MDFLSEVKFGEPFFLRNIVFYPLICPKFLKGRIPATLEEGEFSIRETNPPRVDAVIFENLSNLPVLVLDGEELLGARQNRISNTSVWLEPGRLYKLPVSCVEERRWEGGLSFTPGNTVLNPSLRRILCSGVSKSLAENKGYKSDQHSLWKSIRYTLSTLRVSSRTLSVHDAYESLRSDIERYMSEAEELKGEFSGFIIETPDLIALDLFGSKEVLSKVFKKLIGSYLIEGFLARGRSPSISIRRMKGVISSLSQLDARRYPAAAGLGVEIRFGDGVKLLGKALLVRNELVHLSVFKVR